MSFCGAGDCAQGRIFWILYEDRRHLELPGRDLPGKLWRGKRRGEEGRSESAGAEEDGRVIGPHSFESTSAGSLFGGGGEPAGVRRESSPRSSPSALPLPAARGGLASRTARNGSLR